jgi:hypothetical protein
LARKIIVHIGQPKTGTTSLQAALLKGQKHLLDQGILYPTPLFSINHGALVLPFRQEVQRSMVRFVGTDIREARRRGRIYWRSVVEEAAMHDAGTVIISSEFIWGLRHLPKFYENLQTAFGSEAAIELMAYLRTPSQHYISAAQQKLKMDHRLPIFRYSRLKRLKEVSDIAPLKLGKFSRDALHEGDILSDFCLRYNIKTANLRHRKKEANTTISAEGMILLQTYRRRNHSERGDMPTDDTNRLLNAIAREEAANPGIYTRPKLRPEFAQYLDRDCQTFAWLRKAHGIDLHQDHGVAEGMMRDVAEAEDVSELVGFDPDALHRLRQAVLS